VADEPTTALDVVVEAQILELLDHLRREEQLGLVLITHNLGIVAETADRVAVMYAGRIVEEGPVAAVFAKPAHPYTQGLLASVISLETTQLRSIEGDPPDLVDPPKGCRFRDRCPYAFAPCEWIDPELIDVGSGQRAACLLHDEAVASAAPGAGAPGMGT
jgi:oligopeptide/dipeptide ABC transporter ATP-binding protein